MPLLIRWQRTLLLLLMLVSALVSWAPSAQANITGNVSCTSVGPTNVNMGTLEPGERIVLSISANCRMLRTFPYGGGLTYTATYLGESNTNPGLYFFQGGNSMPVPYGNPGTYSTSCVPGPCAELVAGRQFNINVMAGGVARQKPGTYTLLVVLILTSLFNTDYSEPYVTILYKMKVASPTCKLTSPGAVNLHFGTVSSDQLSSVSQVADVSLSCLSATTAQVTLVPTQTAVPGRTGVSTTTLKGLEMASVWEDTNTPVIFGTPRTFNLGVGSNSLNLRFQPQVSDPGTAPSGNFSSQYTLNVTYL